MTPGGPRTEADGSRASIGARGEAAACGHLERLGWTILARRHRTRFGEIDIVADDGASIVFVEVKCRRGRSCGLPEEALSAVKQQRIVRLAEAWLQGRRLGERPCRFDVIAVDERPGDSHEIRHIRDAFRA